MLDELKFVVGAVARKDYVPELTHIKIRHGWAQGFDGQISAATRIDLDLDVMPSASKMVEAITACKDTVALSVTPAGKLAVRSGTFKCFVPCLEVTDAVLQTFPVPEGERQVVDDRFMEMLAALQPFMSDDASRPWAQGIMLDNKFSFATNNVMLAQFWHGIEIPHTVTIPAAAVNEILKRKEKVTHIQLTENSLTLWFGSEKWLRTQLLENQFSELVYKVIEAPGEAGVPVETWPGFFEAVETLKRFVDEMGGIHFLDGALATTPELEDGAHVSVPGMPQGGIFHVKHLMILKDTARSIDFTPYPGPCRFWGRNKNLRGIFTGRVQ